MRAPVSALPNHKKSSDVSRALGPPSDGKPVGAKHGPRPRRQAPVDVTCQPQPRGRRWGRAERGRPKRPRRQIRATRCDPRPALAVEWGVKSGLRRPFPVPFDGKHQPLALARVGCGRRRRQTAAGDQNAATTREARVLNARALSPLHSPGRPPRCPALAAELRRPPSGGGGGWFRPGKKFFRSAANEKKGEEW